MTEKTMNCLCVNKHSVVLHSETCRDSDLILIEMYLF